jgi:hypothetical protein
MHCVPDGTRRVRRTILYRRAATDADSGRRNEIEPETRGTNRPNWIE